MTIERLREIRDAIWASQGWDRGCTDEEEREIKRAWEHMPGSTTFYGAVCRLIEEGSEEHG